MSLYDYSYSKALIDPPFYGLIMAAMRRADTDNIEKLRQAWPDVWAELQRRYMAPGGLLPEDGHGLHPSSEDISQKLHELFQGPR